MSTVCSLLFSLGTNKDGVSRMGQPTSPALLVCFATLLLIVPIRSGWADNTDTPLAGETYQTEIFGMDIHVPARDRHHVTAVSAGVQWIPDGPSMLEILPFGALFIWHNWEKENRRFRGTIAGLVNDIWIEQGLTSTSPWFALLTFENVVIPFGRSEYVEGQRIREVELEWNYVFGGIGLGYRQSIFPGYQDNAFEVSLTYEPGFLWFDRSSKASKNFNAPQNTYEGRVHGRVRVDALERNLMELLHKGVSVGGDVIYGHRAQWRPWGGEAFESPDASRERTFFSARVYAAMADKVPWVPNERHRLITSIYGGIGKDLDRFSAFRLPGRPAGYEWEALSRPLIPGVAFNELFPRKYAIANLTYRYEALFFLYPYIRGTWSAIERPRFRDNGSIHTQVDMLPALGGGIVSGAPWGSQLEFNYSYNFGIFRDRNGPERGGHGVMVFWSKLL